MGLVYSDITLVNGDNLVLARKHIIGQEEIREMQVNMLVDTGSYNLCINEVIQSQLQFPIVEKRKINDGSVIECDVVDNVEIRLKNRVTTCRAMV
jgi:hypothetical protein